MGAPNVALIEAELEGPPLPEEAEHLWRWFVELDQARGSAGFGPGPITWPDLAAWAELTGRRPRPWECSALMALDQAYRSEWSKAQPKPKAERSG